MCTLPSAMGGWRKRELGIFRRPTVSLHHPFNHDVGAVCCVLPSAMLGWGAPLHARFGPQPGPARGEPAPPRAQPPEPEEEEEDAAAPPQPHPSLLPGLAPQSPRVQHVPRPLPRPGHLNAYPPGPACKNTRPESEARPSPPRPTGGAPRPAGKGQGDGGDAGSSAGVSRLQPPPPVNKAAQLLSRGPGVHPTPHATGCPPPLRPQYKQLGEGRLLLHSIIPSVEAPALQRAPRAPRLPRSPLQRPQGGSELAGVGGGL